MKTFSLITLLLLGWWLSLSPTAAQTFEGKVTYNMTRSWVKIIQRMSFISESEKAQLELNYGKQEGYITPMDLLFTEKKSLYTYAKQQNTGGYSWVEKTYVLFRDFEQHKRFDQIETLGKLYLIEDSIPTPKWKILNDIKEVSGYLCMKAQTYDALKDQKIIAWFAQDLPVQAGPGMYTGLPGLILEVDINDGEVKIEATKVDLQAVEAQIVLPKKLKGKKITNAEYYKMTDEHIKTSIKSRRNPYYSIDY